MRGKQLMCRCPGRETGATGAQSTALLVGVEGRVAVVLVVPPDYKRGDPSAETVHARWRGGRCRRRDGGGERQQSLEKLPGLRNDTGPMYLGTLSLQSGVRWEVAADGWSFPNGPDRACFHRVGSDSNPNPELAFILSLTSQFVTDLELLHIWAYLSQQYWQLLSTNRGQPVESNSS